MDDTREMRFAAALIALADTLRPEHDVIDTMSLLVASVTDLTMASDAGILLVDPSGVLHVVASTSERASDVEESQLGSDDGPCLEAFRSAERVDVPRLSDARSTWPHYVEIAESRGFQAAHALPLSHRDNHLGALGLFFERADSFTEADAAIGGALAQVATIALIQHRTIEHHVTLSDQLQYALEARVLIEQAKGIVASQLGLSIDDAYTRMRDRARRDQLRMRDLAQELIDHRVTL